MGKMGGNRRIKREAAPRVLSIPRKVFEFTVKASSGPHPNRFCIPLAVLVRDTLGLSRTLREAKSAISDGSILVDGVSRRDHGYPVGLMDVVEIPSTGQILRILPSHGRLVAVETPESEKNLKICGVTRKTLLKERIVQFGLTDGRSLRDAKELDLSLGDSLLLEVPSQRIVEAFKMAKGYTGMLTGGLRGGEVGIIEQVRQGTFSRPRMIRLGLASGSSEHPGDHVLVVGKGSPRISLERRA